MNSGHYQQLKNLFAEASMLPAAERERFLADRCGEDLALRERLDRLLAHDERPRRIFEAMPEIDVEGDVEDEAPLLGETAVPRYSLRRRIGEGGFGVVYEAEQLEPIRRSVALKLIKHGFASNTTKLRFTIECQALARLDHPSIARVFDAGTTPSGHLFCSLELIDGLSIREYANEHHLTVAQRIELVVAVCEAVQHAHQRGILHRDLKPSNILVTRVAGRALPKIIDFGIAKLRDDDLPEAQGLTLSGEFIGTPIYMSPEQADPARREIDTRSDVYSLAVVLYELLTGTTPLRVTRMSNTGLEGILRSLREDDVPLASKRVRQLDEEADLHAQRCGTKREALFRALRGDLDRVLAMALEKDRSRRYESPQQFGADLERLLRNEAVLAQSPTTSYLLRKFARRHRGKLAVGVAVFILVLVGAVGTTIGWVNALEAQGRETRQRLIAEREGERARLEAAISGEIVSFLNDDLLASVSPEGLGIDVTMRDALDIASERIEGRFAGLPAVAVALRTTLGATYRSLGANEPAQRHLVEARRLAELHLALDDVRRLRAMRELGAALYAEGRYADADSLLREVLNQSVRVLGERDEDSIAAAYELASVYAERVDQHEARVLVDHWLPVSREVLGPAHPQTIRFLFGRGHIHLASAEPKAALEVFEDAYAQAAAKLGATHRLTLLLINELTELKTQSGARADAETLVRGGLRMAAERLGERHPTTLNLKTRLFGLVYHDPQRGRDANAILEELIEAWPKALRADHPILLHFWEIAAEAWVNQKRDERARDLLERIVVVQEDPPRPVVVRALGELRKIAERAGDQEAARSWQERLDQAMVRMRPH